MAIRVRAMSALNKDVERRVYGHCLGDTDAVLVGCRITRRVMPRSRALDVQRAGKSSEDGFGWGR